MNADFDRSEQIVATVLGSEIVRVHALGGGSLSQIWHVSTRSGSEAVVKRGAMVAREARMLEAMAATGAPVPAVLGVDADCLVIEHLRASGATGRAWSSLGAALAKLHDTAGEHYGWAEDYAFGAVAIPNAPTERWPDFWADRRLVVHAPHVPAPVARRVEKLAGELSGRLPESPRAALLHGDLWGGNVLVAGDSITGFVDPACYHGHVEVDIAMLRLFDQPGRAFFDAYGSLEHGHAERLAIYQLWPALVHLRLFGAAYAGMVDRLLGAAGV